MRVLLVRPVCQNERFGLGPFFRVEPLGLEYIAAALLDGGHDVQIADLRFSSSLEHLLRKLRPGLVGIACSHTVDVPSALAVAERVRRRRADAFVVVGGHAASVHPEPLLRYPVDAVCVGDGEQTLLAVADALEQKRALSKIPGLFVRVAAGDSRGEYTQTALGERQSLDRIPLPARRLVAPFQSHYLCVYKMPVWAIETSRGCPYRCSFCSIWRHNDRTFRTRAIQHVVEDFQQTGPNVFVIDDLFFHPQSRSLELARALAKKNVKKDWILVQARLDTVAKNEELLAAWRPLARSFDLFFGFEAPSDDQLNQLTKDMTIHSVSEGVGVAREHGYGITGNFLVDPDWLESDFQAMWDLVDRLSLERSGYTILTPLPGTPLFDNSARRIQERDWSRWDMHHVLWEPRLGRQRFFELFVESWRRNILNPKKSRAKWRSWVRRLNAQQILQLTRVLWQTRRLLNVEAYLSETFPLQIPALLGAPEGHLPAKCPACQQDA